jgi:excisionase family DNA binding protein
MNGVLTVEEVAARLKVAPKTVRDWLATGKLQGFKAGKLWRIPERALESFTVPEITRVPEPYPTESSVADTLLALLRAVLPEGQPRYLRDLGILTFPLAEINAILERHGLMVRVVRGNDPQRLVTCTVPGGRTDAYGLFELRSLG